jgi:hypothetical protein
MRWLWLHRAAQRAMMKHANLGLNLWTKKMRTCGFLQQMNSEVQSAELIVPRHSKKEAGRPSTCVELLL